MVISQVLALVWGDPLSAPRVPELVEGSKVDVRLDPAVLIDREDLAGGVDAAALRGCA